MVRDRVPVSSQVLPNPPQAPQGPMMSAGQSPSVRHPTQVSVGSLHDEPPLQGSPPWTEQVPPPQVSGPLQKVPSLQTSELGVFRQPAAPQLSSVHTSPSSQPRATQEPPQHISDAVQALSMTHVSPSHRATSQAPATQVLGLHPSY